jgi:hypothetical protein
MIMPPIVANGVQRQAMTAREFHSLKNHETGPYTHAFWISERGIGIPVIKIVQWLGGVDKFFIILCSGVTLLLEGSDVLAVV